MVDFEAITATAVRHQWKEIVAGLASGKVYRVENHGEPEAIVISPRNWPVKTTDLEAHFRKVLSRTPTPLAAVEVQRAPEV